LAGREINKLLTCFFEILVLYLYQERGDNVKDYLMNAYHYIKQLVRHVNNWKDVDEVNDALGKVFWDCGVHATLEYGVARMVVVGPDFVFKWNYDENCVTEVGGCEEEFNKYKSCLSSGYSYLLAPVYRINYSARFFYIMPKIENIGDRAHGYKPIEYFLSNEEYFWIKEQVGDLHSYNWGLMKGKPVVIDYACNPNFGDS
jgi:hypothetical protein